MVERSPSIPAERVHMGTPYPPVRDRHEELPNRAMYLAPTNGTLVGMSQIITDRKGRPISATVSIILAVLTLGYMLPWMVAALRGKSNHWAVCLVNLLLGWTLIGWIVALVMACTAHQVAGVRQAQL